MATGLTDRLTEFTRALREHGIQCGPGETTDAAAALRVLGVADRERMREGLAAALIRRDAQRAVFDATFDLYFPLGVGPPELARGHRAGRDDLRDRLVAALAEDDAAALGEIAGMAVDSLGYLRTGEGSGSWSAYRTLDRLQPQNLLTRVLAAMRAGDGPGDDADAVEFPQEFPPEFTARLHRDEIRGRIEAFRERVRGEARRRVSEVRDRDMVAKHAIQPSADRAEFLTASRIQLAELRRAVHPLARKLATRLAARRKHATRGQINVRATVRRSLGTGGVPLRPVYRHRRPSRPELVLLCDVSGSVAGFAQFTMLLVQALHDQFSKLRVFAFVDGTDEITGLLREGCADPEELGSRIHSESAVSTWDGHSDYGRALREFEQEYHDAVGPRTSVLILGDARTNGGDPNTAALTAIAERARRVYWLNPERAGLWRQGDSVAAVYREIVPMYECRTAAQLSALVSRLLPV